MSAGQSNGEFSELAEATIYLDVATMLLSHDVVADREAKTGSLAGRLRREERLEKFIFDLGRDAAAVVTDADLDCIVEISRRHLQSRLEIRVSYFSLAFGDRIETIAE